MDDEQAIAAGHRAYNELNELRGVFERIEAGIFAEMKQTAIGADVKVQRLHLTLHTLSQIQTALREIVDNGRVAEQALAIAGLNRPN